MPNTTKNRSSGVEDVLKPDEPAARQPSPIREGWKKEQIAKTFVKTLLRHFDSAMIAIQRRKHRKSLHSVAETKPESSVDSQKILRRPPLSGRFVPRISNQGATDIAQLDRVKLL
jgi:hypothetical protein